MIEPQMSGHCANPATDDPLSSHLRCERMGAGNRARPSKEFQACPCGCHLGDGPFECGECGGELYEAPFWESVFDLEEGEVVYVHVDPDTGRAVSEECA